MLCVLIMAGGKGTRFWPQSTDEKPKQFLNLVEDRTMLKMTYDRVNKIVDKENIFVATNTSYFKLVKEQLPEIEDKNIILETASKNTAPCILLSSLYINQYFKGANIVCVPSDHIIQDEEQFIKDIKLADDFVNKTLDAIVTIGIKPTRPETAYGYIKYKQDKVPVLKVEQFVEKPNLEVAKKYLESNAYLWNAGMFIFNVDRMLKELKRELPNDFSLLSELPTVRNEQYFEKLKENYEKCTKISIDYAVMEKSENVYTIPTDFGWDDVGTWKSLERYLKRDENENLLKGNVKVINSKNNIVYANNKKIILLDIDDIICVDSEDCLIVSKKENIEKIHDLRGE